MGCSRRPMSASLVATPLPFRSLSFSPTHADNRDAEATARGSNLDALATVVQLPPELRVEILSFAGVRLLAEARPTTPSWPLRGYNAADIREALLNDNASAWSDLLALPYAQCVAVAATQAVFGGANDPPTNLVATSRPSPRLLWRLHALEFERVVLDACAVSETFRAALVDGSAEVRAETRDRVVAALVDELAVATHPCIANSERVLVALDMA